MGFSFFRGKNSVLNRIILRRNVNMITFLALVLILIILAVVSVIILAVGGSAFILVFGDLIVCIAIIVWIIKHIFKKKK